MHTGFAGQLRYLMLQNFLAVLVVAQLLLGFGFFAAEIGARSVFGWVMASRSFTDKKPNNRY